MVSALYLVTGAASAGGFQIFEQSVKGLGHAFAGSAASADDAATVFFNPAGMTRLSGTQIQGAGYVIVTRANFIDEGSLDGRGQPLQGPAADGGISTAVWNGYLATPLTDRLSLGFGINTPFGLGTDYPRTWVGRYHAVESGLRTLNLSPVAAFKLHDSLSIGAGIDVQYIDVLLSNAIDLGTFFAPTGLTSPGGDDGFQEIKAKDWGLGYNVGLLFTPTDTTRIGLTFRSGIDFDLRGEAKFQKSAQIDSALAVTGLSSLLQDTGARAAVSLPDTFSIGAYHRVSARWALLAGISWTRWGDLEDEILIGFDNPAQPPQVLRLDFTDAFRYGVGVNFDANPRLTLRAGVAYDETPIPGPESRSARLPDADRWWVAGGVTYLVTRTMFVDIAYAHLFVRDAEIRSTLPNALPQLQSRLIGRFQNGVDIIGAQIGWSF
ncbi:MAG: OmpP1/FadL family transporter [Gammaproteobacteria bacterium]